MSVRYLIRGAPQPGHPALLAPMAGDLKLFGRHDALALFVRADDPVLDLAAIGGWLIGRLFTRFNHRPVAALDADAQTRIAATGGQYLIDRFWGSYVAVWRASDGQWQALRDPSATMPAFCGARRTVASDVELLIDGAGLPLRIDWSSLAHHLRQPLLPTTQTCLEGIEEILPGQRRSLGGPPGAVMLWHPASFLRPAAIAYATDETCDRLARTIDSVVAGWSSCFARVALELSGGLDSSILAAALARTGVDRSAVTIATASAEGDERRYARIVAGQCGMPLSEHILAVDAVRPLGELPHLTARPTGMRLLNGLDRLFQDAADAAGADAAFSGTGGDNIFCYLRSTAPVLDALHAAGPGLALRAFANLLAFADVTAWEAGASLFRRAWRERHRAPSWATDDRYLAAGLVPEPRNHPWLAGAGRLPSGQRAHIKALLAVHPILAGHARIAARTMIFPLLSQPVMEACLAIPSWQWMAGGRDREPARRAFARRLPPQIIERRLKGHLESVEAAAFERDHDALRDLLGDARLTRQGVLDGKAIATALATPAGADVVRQARLFMLADAELWVRAVEQRGAAPAFGH